MRKKGTIIKDIQSKSHAYIQIPGKPVEGIYPPVRYDSSPLLDDG